MIKNERFIKYFAQIELQTIIFNTWYKNGQIIRSHKQNPKYASIRGLEVS